MIPRDRLHLLHGGGKVDHTEGLPLSPGGRPFQCLVLHHGRGTTDHDTTCDLYQSWVCLDSA